MESQNNFGATCFNSFDNALNCGDPAESIAVATAQFRSLYQFVCAAQLQRELGQHHRARRAPA